MDNVVNIYRHNTTNVGDRYSSPSMYFKWLRDIEKVDIYTDNVSKIIKDIHNKILILGGGGLIANKDFEKSLKWINLSSFKKKVIWGAGHNTHSQIKFQKMNRYLEKFDLIGIRDYGTKYEWVPCVSCLHKAFDKHYSIKHKVVVYEHKDFPLSINLYPKRNNQSDNIEEIINFLSSGETVITNTYHGVYWATLLQRKVILVDPFSTKFNRFKHPPTISKIENFEKQLSKTIVYPEALNESRQANINFASRVKELIYANL